MTESESFLVARVNEEMDLAVYLSDEAGHISVWNRAAEKLFGFSADELKQKSERDLYWDQNESINDGGVRYAWRIAKDRRMLFIKESVVEIADPSTPGDRFMKILEDCTESLNPWEKCDLWVSQFSDAKHGVFIANGKTRRFQFLNKYFVSLCGGTPEELLRAPAEDFLVEGRKLKLCPTKTPQKYIIADVEVKVILTLDNQPLYYIGHVRPISSEVELIGEAELELLASGKTLEQKCLDWFSHYKDASKGAYISDARTNTILYVNEYMASHLGYNSHELIGVAETVLSPPSFSEKAWDLFTQVETQGWRLDKFDFSKRDGSLQPSEVCSIGIFDHGNHIVYRVSVTDFKSTSPIKHSH